MKTKNLFAKHDIKDIVTALEKKGLYIIRTNNIDWIEANVNDITIDLIGVNEFKITRNSKAS